MVKVNDLVDGNVVKSRRARLGISQAVLAKKVAELSGKTFSQQALAKFEKGGESTQAVSILLALDELEREAGIAYISPRRPLSMQADIEKLSDSQLKATIISIVDQLSARDSIELAQMILERAKQQI